MTLENARSPSSRPAEDVAGDARAGTGLLRPRRLERITGRLTRQYDRCGRCTGEAVSAVLREGERTSGEYADRRGVDAPLPGGEPGGVRELFSRITAPWSGLPGRMRGTPHRGGGGPEIFLRIARARPSTAPPRIPPWNVHHRPARDAHYCGTRRRGEKVPILFGRGGEDGVYPVQLPGRTTGPGAVVWKRSSRNVSGPPWGTPGGVPGRVLLNRGTGSPTRSGAVLGVTVQAVKTRIFRAREMLLSRLSKDVSGVQLFPCHGFTGTGRRMTMGCRDIHERSAPAWTAKRRPEARRVREHLASASGAAVLERADARGGGGCPPGPGSVPGPVPREVFAPSRIRGAYEAKRSFPRMALGGRPAGCRRRIGALPPHLARTVGDPFLRVPELPGSRRPHRTAPSPQVDPAALSTGPGDARTARHSRRPGRVRRDDDAEGMELLARETPRIRRPSPGGRSEAWPGIHSVS